jgi:adenine deaminase
VSSAEWKATCNEGKEVFRVSRNLPAPNTNRRNFSMENAQRKEQELMQMRDDLMQLNDTYTSRLMTKELEMNTELYGKITELLDRYSKEAGYDYILGFSIGGGILYASAQHDITNIIIRMYLTVNTMLVNRKNFSEDCSLFYLLFLQMHILLLLQLPGMPL